ncbi:MAG: alpha/beta fold hydrolase [Actinomycetota bacterium]|nr:alpha/beta fold hydrolase [Actinomycetota bacterium]
MGETTAGLIEQLPGRFLAHKYDLPRTTFRLKVGRTIRDVVVEDGTCEVRRAAGDADAEIITDPVTWRAMDRGRMSGVEAFALRRLSVRGSIEKSLWFEPIFERRSGGGFRYEIQRVSLGGTELEVLSGGDEENPPLVLIHGLAATKASWLPVVPALAKNHKVYAIDLPGFGASSKPWGRYDAEFFAEHVLRFLEVTGLRRAYIAGNSMGGRVAMEAALLEPERVAAIACLCPAAAWRRRPALQLVKLLRPEWGISIFKLPRQTLRENLMQLFADPTRIEDDWYDAAIDDFLNYWRSPWARLAVFSAARNIYLDEPDGDDGFWSRLKKMKPPALYIYGSKDVLVTARFGRMVSKSLPSANVEVWPDCGHVPQLEHPDRTAKTMLDFFSKVGRAARAG